MFTKFLFQLNFARALTLYTIIMIEKINIFLKNMLIRFVTYVLINKHEKEKKKKRKKKWLLRLLG